MAKRRDKNILSWHNALFFCSRSFTAQADFFSGFKRLGAYAVFAFGVPAIIVSVGLILESVYE
jgi:hypothetical protein